MSFDLDHIGIAVHDLDAAAAQFQRLGFQLTPRGHHTLPAPTPGAPRPRVGTSNNCAMLGRGYLELIGITNGAYQGRLREALARYEGIHIVAFGTNDAAAASRELRAAGVSVKDTAILERPVEDELARFAIVEWPADLLPQCYFFTIQHLTRDVLWKPGLLTHPNGARSLEGITIAAADPADFAARLGRAVAATPEGGTLRLAPGRVSVVQASALGHAAPSLPCVAGTTLGTADLKRTAEHLTRNSIGFERGATALRVPPAEACGAFIEFIQT